MSRCIFSQPRPSLPVFDFPLSASGPNAFKKKQNKKKTLNQRFGWLFPALTSVTLQEKHLTEPECCQTTCCGGPLAQHNDHTYAKHSFKNTRTRTHTVGISSYCTGLCTKTTCVRCHVFLFLSLCLSVCPSRMQEQLKSLQSGFKHVNDGGFQMQRWVYARAHTHTHTRIQMHTHIQ